MDIHLLLASLAVAAVQLGVAVIVYMLGSRRPTRKEKPFTGYTGE